MNRSLRGFGAAKWMVLTASVVLIMPRALQAAWLGFRNDLKVPIVVQGTTVINNVARRDKPQTLYPGEVSWDPILRPGSKLIMIYDTKRPPRLLFQDTITIKDDLFLSIQVDKTGKPQLVPTKMPPMSPRVGR
jgi:hypothetical protein